MVENEALRQVDRAEDSGTKAGGKELNLLDLMGAGRGEAAQQQKDVQKQVSGGSGTEQGGNGMLEMTNPFPEGNVCLPEGETGPKEDPGKKNEGGGGTGGRAGQNEKNTDGGGNQSGSNNEGGGGGHLDTNAHQQEHEALTHTGPHRQKH